MPFKLIVNIKRILVACMAIALAITSSMLYMKKTPRQDSNTAKSERLRVSSKSTTAASSQPVYDNDHLARIAVIVLNGGKESSLEIKAGDKHIKIPGPSSWPKSDDDATSGVENGRFIAGIIDTADILKANGFNPDTAFSFVVGDTVLTASNTFRVVGNHQPDSAINSGNSFTEEYHTLPGDEGIWRSLKFKNIVLSYEQVPSLADFLEGPQTSSGKTSALNVNGPSVQGYQEPSAPVDDTSNNEEDVQKYREAMNNSNPAIRSEGIQNLLLFSDPLTSEKSQPSIETYIDKALADSDPTVREAALRSLDLWDGNIPMQTLGKIVLNDQSPELRMQALSLLVDRFEERSIPILQQASHDPDSRVANKASELMNSFSQ